MNKTFDFKREDVEQSFLRDKEEYDFKKDFEKELKKFNKIS